MPEGAVFSHSSTARVAGAMAHELNNPLQGLLVALELSAQEFSGDERLTRLLGQIEGGVRRVSTAVRSFSAVYENLPREPEYFPVGEIIWNVTAILEERGIRIDPTEITDSRKVLCHAREISQLMSEVVSASELRNQRLVWYLESDEGVCSVRILAAEAGQIEWVRLVDGNGLSGLPVVLDEFAKLSDGYIELAWRDESIVGISIVLKT